MKKKLFTIRDNKTGKQYGEDSFANKVDAKVLRDTLNETSKNKYSVTLGPDHWQYQWYQQWHDKKDENNNV